MKIKIKTIITIIIALIYCTGCSATYTLKFNNDLKVSDNLIVESSDTTISSERNNNINKYASIYRQAFHYNGILNNYYEISKYGVNVINDYKTIDEFNSSDVCKSFNCNVKNVSYNDYNMLIIQINYDSFVFRDCGEGDCNGPSYVYFDIEFPFEVLDTNAVEKINDNKYRWVLNEKDLKEITIKYTTEEIKNRQKENEKKQTIITLAIFGGYFLLIIAILAIKKIIKNRDLK